jgi:UDP-glucose 4-epimerase
LLEALRIRGEEKSLIFASSSSVYGEQSDSKITEGSPIRPVSVYGATKASCEMLIRAYSVLYGIKSVSLRFANIIGPRLRHGVIYDFVNKLRRDTTRLQILGDGKQTRSYLHVNDTVAATLTILDSIEKSAERYEVYNIGNEDWLSVNQVADLVLEVMDLVNIKRDYKQVLQGVGWPGDVKRITLDITKLRKLGFSPRMTGRNAALSTTKSILEELDQEL